MLKALHSGFFISSAFLAAFTIIPGLQPTTNQSPTVKIIQPVNNALFEWGARIPYSVEVSDPEDGESKYQEIQSAEVLVRIKYVMKSVNATAFLKQQKQQDSTVITSMMVSNCFNCHGVKSNSAGPSFRDISLKYQPSASNREQLVNHIERGSTGIWGKEVMPTHPELQDTVVRQMVKWILYNAKDPGLNFFVGMQGILILNRTKKTDRGGFFIVTAFYTDHGSVNFPNKRITGSGQVIIQMK